MDSNRSHGSRAVLLLTWVVACCFITAAIAWLGFLLQQSAVAPAGIYSLTIGAAIGAATAGAWRGLGLVGRVPIIATLLWTAGGLVVQEQLAFRKYLDIRAETLAGNPQMAAVMEHTKTAPLEFGAFMGHRFERARWWWIADGVLTALAAIIGAAAVLGRRLAGETEANA